MMKTLTEKDIVRSGLWLLAILFVLIILFTTFYSYYNSSLLTGLNWLWVVVAILVVSFYLTYKIKWTNVSRLKPRNKIRRSFIVFGLIILLALVIFSLVEDFVVPLCSPFFSLGFPYNVINVIKFFIAFVSLMLAGFLFYKLGVTEKPSRAIPAFILLAFLLILGILGSPVCSV